MEWGGGGGGGGVGSEERKRERKRERERGGALISYPKRMFFLLSSQRARYDTFYVCGGGGRGG